MSAPALLGLGEQAPRGASGALIGPDMTQLWQRFPPRSPAPSWPMTEQAREALLARLLAPPFTVEENRVARQRRRLGLVRLLDWLTEQPGDTWQQRWLVSGADAKGNADWWRPLLAWARPRNPSAGVSTSSNLRVCALLLTGADVIRPSLDWVLTPRAPQNLVAVMTRARDPHGFAELSALGAASPAGRTTRTAALRRAATILAVKGGTLREITVGDCLELSLAIDGRSLRTPASPKPAARAGLARPTACRSASPAPARSSPNSTKSRPRRPAPSLGCPPSRRSLDAWSRSPRVRSNRRRETPTRTPEKIII